MKPIKVMSVFGTRPEAVKMAPLALELAKDNRFESMVCVTAQHRQMLDGVLSCFGISPDFDLDIMQAGQTLTDITSRVLSGLGEILKREQPNLVLVHGDTTTTFSGALIGATKLLGEFDGSCEGFQIVSAKRNLGALEQQRGDFLLRLLLVGALFGELLDKLIERANVELLDIEREFCGARLGAVVGDG